MTSLIRWDPFREMMTLRTQMDRLMEDLFNLPTAWSEGEATTFWRLPLDVIERDDAFIVKASLPGVKPEDLDISYVDNTLTIKGELKEEVQQEGERYHLRERRFGQFMRSITLPVAIDPDKIEAVYENGVLTLTLPKAEEVKPRKIQVHVGGNGHKVVEGKAS